MTKHWRLYSVLSAALHDQPPGPAATLGAWQAAWPALRQQIEALISEQVERDLHFYGYHAEMASQKFAGALQTLAALTVQLESQACNTVCCHLTNVGGNTTANGRWLPGSNGVGSRFQPPAPMSCADKM